MKSYEPRLVALARSFPTLESAPLSPFNAEELDKWAGTASSGGAHAARFILTVYNSNNSNPLQRVRRKLLEDINSVYERCSRAVPDDEGTEAQRRAARRANDLAEDARYLYRDGELAKASRKAELAQNAHAGWRPFRDWLAKPRQITEAEILKDMREAEVWECGVFDTMAALGTWDPTHRAAFAAWVAAPWWA